MTTALRIPAATVRAVAERFGAAGVEWVEAQDRALADFAKRYSLALDRVIDGGLDQNSVFLVNQAGVSRVLKTGYPEPELFTELGVLQHWRGQPGCVQLLEADLVNGIMLMERVTTGQTFRQAVAADRSEEIPDLFEQTTLTSVDAGFPDYSGWVGRAFAQYEQRPLAEFDSHLALARGFCAELLAPGAEQSLIHGDLHHENMLRDERGWTAIDPKGVIGPPVLNYGRFIHNFMADVAQDSAAIQAVLSQRVDKLAGRFSRESLLQAGYLDLVLSVCWTLNGGSPLRPQTRLLLESYARLF